MVLLDLWLHGLWDCSRYLYVDTPSCKLKWKVRMNDCPFTRILVVNEKAQEVFYFHHGYYYCPGFFFKTIQRNSSRFLDQPLLQGASAHICAPKEVILLPNLLFNFEEEAHLRTIIKHDRRITIARQGFLNGIANKFGKSLSGFRA